MKNRFLFRRAAFALALCTLPAMAAPVSLDDAYKSASTKNEIVQQGLERIRQIEATQSQVTGGIFPNVSLNGNQTRIDAPPPAFAAFSPQDQTTVSLTVKQPLFRGLREWNRLKSMDHLRSAQVATQEQLMAKLYQDVAAAYLQVLTLEQDLKNLGEQRGLYDDRVKELGARVRRGESNETDVVTAEATQSTLVAESLVLEGQLDAARETFQFLTTLPKDSALTDPNILRGMTLAPVETYLERIEQRPDVTAAARRFEASQKSVSEAWGTHFPSVDLIGNYHFKRPGFMDTIKWDIGVYFVVPIFEGFATQAKVTESVSKRKEAELELEHTRRAARQEIRTLHRRLVARLAQLKSIERSATLSKRNASLLQRDYRRGLARSIDVQLALTESRVAQRGLDTAHFTSQLELIQLQAATAQGVPK